MARSFNGSNQYAKYGGTVVATEPLTISAWFYPTSLDDEVVAAVAKDSDTVAKSIRFIRTRGDVAGDPFEAQSDGAAGARSGNSCNANQWNHGLGIFVAKNSRSVMLNGGSLVTGTASFSSAVNAENATIAAFAWNNTVANFFTGYIAEVAIWNVALTEAEGQILAKGYSPLFVRPQSLVAYWPLLGRTSPEIDIVGGYAMTLYNSPPTVDHPRVLMPTLMALNVTAATTVRLAWTDNSEGEDGFSIERKTGAGAYAVVHTTAAGVETWDDTSVPAGATYTYRVQALSAALGDSEYSNEAEVTV